MKIDITTIPTDLVSIKEQKGYKVLKYKNKVFYNNLWDKHPILKECRGMVLDAENNVVAWPFTKVFNIGENGTKFPELPFCLVDKKNGFLGVLSIGKEGGLLFSTTGSLESEFVDMWRAMFWDYAQSKILDQDFVDLKLHLYNILTHTTLMFEVCHPADPHIIKEDHGIYLIGGRSKSTQGMLLETELDIIADIFGWKRPEWCMVYTKEVLDQLLSGCQHEGFMVRDFNGNIVAKYKSKNYLRRKLLTRCSEDKIALLYNMCIKELFEVGLEEEFVQIVTELRYSYTAEQWASMSQAERLKVLDNLD